MSSESHWGKKHQIEQKGKRSLEKEEEVREQEEGKLHTQKHLNGPAFIQSTSFTLE